jgi:Putative restriction endonuclease
LPGPDDVALLVEVADTSLRYDRRVKGLLYAEAGIREYWIVDLAGDVVESFASPERTASSAPTAAAAAARSRRSRFPTRRSPPPTSSADREERRGTKGRSMTPCGR